MVSERTVVFAASGYQIAMKICKDCILENYMKQLKSLITVQKLAAICEILILGPSEDFVCQYIL